LRRHREKDDEAGGEGLGVLGTRKRCWRDEEGRVTKVRPRGVEIQPQHSPRLAGEMETEGSGEGVGVGVGVVRPADQGTGTGGIVDTLAACQAGFETAFSADTARSFGMPYATLSNYTWLFDEELGYLRTPTYGEFQQEEGNAAAQAGWDVAEYVSMPQQQQPVEDATMYLHPLPPQDHQLPLPYEPQRHQVEQHALPPPPMPQQLEQVSSSPETVEQLMGSGTMGSDTYHSVHQSHSTPPTQCSPASASAGCLLPSAITETDTRLSLPKLDEVARAQVIKLIVSSTANTTTPVSADDPLLSLSALQNYCDLFFSRFNTAYPLLHRPSFDPGSVQTLLLISVLMLGATYGGKEAHAMAGGVHDVLRGVLVSVSAILLRLGGWLLMRAERLLSCYAGAVGVANSAADRGVWQEQS
jgi:hypothetical protein